MMSRLFLGMCLAVLAFGAGASAAPASDAKAPADGVGHAASGGHDDHHGEPPVYKAHLHYVENGKHVEKEVKFDMRKEEDRKAYLNHVARGEVHEAKLDKPVELLSLKWDLGLWSIVVFLVLFFVLAKFAWPQILEGLQAREGNIQGALDEAEKTRAEAQKLQAQFQQQLAQANDQVRGLLDEARRDAARTTEEMIAKARTEITADRDRLRRELETARDQAIQELWGQSVQLASMMSAKAIKQNLDPAAHQKLFKEALADLDAATERMTRS